MTDIEEIIVEMFDRFVVSFGDFRLKDGSHSPIYVNMRILPSWPILLEKVAKAMLRKVHSDAFIGNRFAGLPMSGVPIAVAMGLIGKIPVLYPRQQPLTMANGLQVVEGFYKPEDHVIVIDDVLTDGAIKAAQITTIRACTLNVRDLLVVVDREAGGKEAMNEIGVRVHSLTTLKNVVEVLRRRADLCDYEYERTMEYFAARKYSLEVVP